MLESTNPLKSQSALQSASIQDNSFAPETDLNTLNLSGSSQSLNNEVLTSDINAQQNPNPSPYISSPPLFLLILMEMVFTIKCGVIPQQVKMLFG